MPPPRDPLDDPTGRGSPILRNLVVLTSFDGGTSGRVGRYGAKRDPGFVHVVEAAVEYADVAVGVPETGNGSESAPTSSPLESTCRKANSIHRPSRAAPAAAILLISMPSTTVTSR
jgi:hypothetical protein